MGKKLKLLNLNNLQKKILKRYQVNSIDEYISLIKINIDNIEKLKEIDKIYNKNKNKDIEEEKEQEKQRIYKLLTSSIKRKNSNVKIRMLIEKDQEKAANLYIKFKKIMDEDMEEAENI